jgi:chromosome partitioning protein
MLKIAIVNSKGGVGKTTLTASLAVRATKDFERVACVDLDPQGSLVKWWGRRGRPEVPEVMSGVDSAEDAIERLEQTGWDVCFMDGPPAFLATVEEMISVADFVVVPIKPSVLDLLATQDTILLCQRAKAEFVCVLNDVQRSEKTILKSTQGTLFNHKIPLASSIVHHRVSHITAQAAGKSAAEVNKGSDEEAAREIDDLWKEVKALAVKAAKARSKRGRAA